MTCNEKFFWIFSNEFYSDKARSFEDNQLDLDNFFRVFREYKDDHFKFTFRELKVNEKVFLAYKSLLMFTSSSKVKKKGDDMRDEYQKEFNFENFIKKCEVEFNGGEKFTQLPKMKNEIKTAIKDILKEIDMESIKKLNTISYSTTEFARKVLDIVEETSGISWIYSLSPCQIVRVFNKLVSILFEFVYGKRVCKNIVSTPIELEIIVIDQKKIEGIIEDMERLNNLFDVDGDGYQSILKETKERNKKQK